jgi:hypothetical protein
VVDRSAKLDLEGVFRRVDCCAGTGKEDFGRGNFETLGIPEGREG